MKTAFRMLVSTAVAAAVLYVLHITHDYFVAQSMLGATVDHVVTMCFQLLALVTVLLYVRCWLSLLWDGICALVRRCKARRSTAKTGLKMTIEADAPARLFDREAEDASV